MLPGSCGRGSNKRQARRSTARARMVRPSDLWKLKIGITFGRLGSSTMIRPIAHCTRISTTIVQWKNLATPPQWFSPLLSMSRLRLRWRSVSRFGLAAQAFGLDAARHRVADVRQVFAHAEIRALERGRGREARGVAQVVGIESGAIERYVQVQWMRLAAQRQLAAHDRGFRTGLLDRLRNEARVRVFAGIEKLPRTHGVVPLRIAQIGGRGVDDDIQFRVVPM